MNIVVIEGYFSTFDLVCDERNCVLFPSDFFHYRSCVVCRGSFAIESFHINSVRMIKVGRMHQGTEFPLQLKITIV